MMEINNIVVAHPLQQHSFYTAAGLKQNDVLKQYITSFYYSDEKIFYRFVEKTLPNYSKRIKNRRSLILDDTVTTFCTIKYLILNLIYKLDKKNYIYPFAYRLFCDSFGKKVAKYCIKNNVDMIIMYDTTASKCFSILKKEKPEIKRILDMSSPNTSFIRDIINKDIFMNPKSKKQFEDKLRWYNTKLCELSSVEIQLADDIICGSEFCKQSILDDYKVTKSYVIPYGVDKIFLNNIKREYNSTLKFLYAGRLENSKGIIYLLDAFKQCEDIDVSLTLVGQNYLPKGEIDLYKNVRYAGLLRKDEMIDMYNNCDIYIMPSLFEGLSLTIIEAMAASLPVIATVNSGANSIVTNNVDGFVINPMSTDEIVKCIRWFDNNRNLIKDMADNAFETSKKFTWDLYNEKYFNVLKSVGE